MTGGGLDVQAQALVARIRSVVCVDDDVDQELKASGALGLLDQLQGIKKAVKTLEALWARRGSQMK